MLKRLFESHLMSGRNLWLAFTSLAVVAMTPICFSKRTASRRVDQIIIHCTATPVGREVHAADVDRWHRQRGFRCIGYHYLITLDGTIEQGRSEAETGAHCRGHNSRSIGVCYVGGLDRNGNPADTRTEAQRRAMHALVDTLLERYPGATIHAHNEFSAKACPCFDVKREFAARQSKRGGEL